VEANGGDLSGRFVCPASGISGPTRPFFRSPQPMHTGVVLHSMAFFMQHATNTLLSSDMRAQTHIVVATASAAKQKSGCLGVREKRGLRRCRRPAVAFTLRICRCRTRHRVRIATLNVCNSIESRVGKDLPAGRKVERLSTSRRLPSGSKLYTLRGVSTVGVTVTSIRNCRRTLSWRYPSGPGKQGLYAALRAYGIERPILWLRLGSAGLTGTLHLHI